MRIVHPPAQPGHAAGADAFAAKQAEATAPLPGAALHATVKSETSSTDSQGSAKDGDSRSESGSSSGGGSAGGCLRGISGDLAVTF